MGGFPVAYWLEWTKAHPTKSRLSSVQMRIMASPPPLHRRPLQIARVCTTLQWPLSGRETAMGRCASSVALPFEAKSSTLKVRKTASCKPAPAMSPNHQNQETAFGRRAQGLGKSVDVRERSRLNSEPDYLTYQPVVPFAGRWLLWVCRQPYCTCSAT